MLLMHISHNTDYFKSVITFAQFGRDEDATREFYKQRRYYGGIIRKN